MTLVNTAGIAVKALTRNPTRALLTTLGIIIGIAAVIAMMEIGNGSKASMQQSIIRMGANAVTILPGWSRTAGVSMGMGSRVTLTPQDAEAIGRECPSVARYSPIVRTGNLQAIYGNSNWVPSQIYGVAPSYLEIRNWEIAEGRNFSEQEVEDKSRVCLVGETVIRELFNGISPLGCDIRLRNVSFRVIGVLRGKGSNMIGMDEDDVLIAPWSTIRTRLTGNKTGSPTNTSSTPALSPSELYSSTGVAFFPEQDPALKNDKLLVPQFVYIDQIIFSAVSTSQIKQAEREVSALLRERHRLSAGAEDDFRIRNPADFMNTLNQTSMLMTNLLLGVALLSLLVGGVGIMNIMLVSVTERTREIGLRMAVGARAADILRQFLVESVILCLLGGILGIFAGHGIAWLVNFKLGWPVESSPGAVAAAFGVSVAVGVLFGFYPAWKAAKLDPIDALRYE